MNAAERFWSKVDKSGECWLWQGGHNGKGYGRFWVNGGLVYAHRWSFEQAMGLIPGGMVLDHLCRRPACVRPDHLETVTAGENVTRGVIGFGLTGKCRAGIHDVTNAANIHIRANGKRQCLPCLRTARAIYWQEKSA